MTKKITAVLLSLCMLVPLASVCASAETASLSDGLPALQDTFKFGIGSAVNNVTMDYYYFEPDADGKYPLVIWLHGLVSGGWPGRQITKNDISYWASKEFQSRFTGGGAFILAPRSTETVSVWGDNMVEPLKGCIDQFIAAHSDKIDTKRIYLGGLSMGGKMTVKMTAAYPEMFAAVFPCSPYYTLSDELAKGCANTPIWQLSSKDDCYMDYETRIKPDWDKMMSYSNRRADCRYTVMDTALKPDGTAPGTTHDTWYAATYDMFMYNRAEFTGSVTYDGNGRVVTLKYPRGMIYWLNRYTSDYVPEKLPEQAPSTMFGNMYRVLMALFAALARALGLKGVLG